VGTGGTGATGGTAGTGGTGATGGTAGASSPGLVPGGVFSMGRSTSGPDMFASGNANELPEHSASVSQFRLDVSEVTVERFRRFVSQYPGSRPAAGAGAHPGIPNSGWKAAWNSLVSADSSNLTIELKCSFRATWTDEPVQANEQKPINCVTWYMAFAFCAFDGGFLPSEAEWEFAAAGGGENRLYPWGAAAPDPVRASYDCRFDGNPVCDYTDIPLVRGTSGVGSFGHYELGGSMREWVLDSYDAAFYTQGTCTNCARLLADTVPRVTRGGGWLSEPGDLRAATRIASDERGEDIGVRCARAP
jgi:formylglycine-generating enzyme